MNVRCLTTLAGALAMSGAANGGFVGLHVDQFDRDYFANYTGDPGIDNEIVSYYDAGWRVFRVYLRFDNLEEDAGDRLLWWGGSDGTDDLGPLSIEGAEIYNVAWHDDPFFKPAFNSVFVPGQRDAPFDSWIAFGSDAEGDPAEGELLGEFADGTIPMWEYPLYSENAGITADPSLNQGDAWAQTTPGLVPIFQVTVRDYDWLCVDFSFTWDVEGGPPGDQFNETASFCYIPPAPGALALFGLAGLGGTRRRRG
jgi:uncharacterized protein (TIGR03382 family)